MDILGRGLDLSPVHECLIEESVLGWKEYELEVIRDLADNVIIICSIENMDPMGVHTGDSITVAPAQTLTDREYQSMRDAAIRVIRGAFGVPATGPPLFWSAEQGIDRCRGRSHLVEAPGGEGQVAVVVADEVARSRRYHGRDVRRRASEEVGRARVVLGHDGVVERESAGGHLNAAAIVCAELPVMVLFRIVVLGPSAWMPPPKLAELLAKVLFWTNSVPWPFSSP